MPQDRSERCVGRAPWLPAIVGVWLACWLGGCATPGSLDSASAPDDFVLGVTVYDRPSATPVSTTKGEDLPRALRPGRYVVEADGVLRASLGNAAAADVFPPMTRRLNRDQIDRLWALTTATGVFEREADEAFAGEGVGPVAAYQPPSGRITALIEAFAAGRRTATAMSVESAEQSDRPVRALTDALAELAWVPEDAVDVEAELRSRNALRP